MQLALEHELDLLILEDAREIAMYVENFRNTPDAINEELRRKSLSHEERNWFGQIVGAEWHWLEYYENNGFGLDHYVDYVKALPFTVHHHFLPHDGEARELQTGKSRREYLEGRGFKVSVVPRHEVDDGINAARVRFNRMFFDAEGCKRGIDCLRMYRSEFDVKHQTLKSRPLHDWSSHGADAFRCGVMGAEEKLQRPERPTVRFSAGSWMG
jgi:phage terminase large subunit